MTSLPACMRGSTVVMKRRKSTSSSKGSRCARPGKSKVRTTRSKHGFAQGTTCEHKSMVKTSRSKLVYVLSSGGWTHCEHDNAFALVYIAQLGVLHVVESHA
jgi:hypothetical protein